MAKVSMSKAAKLAGKSRTTLYKHIENGTLSAQKNAKGHHIIDIAELERVYGSLNSVDVQDNVQVDKPERSGDTSGGQRTALLKQEILFKDEQIRSLKDQLAEAKEEKRDLLGVVKAHARLLEAHKEDQEPAPKKRWRFFGGRA